MTPGLKDKGRIRPISLPTNSMKVSLIMIFNASACSHFFVWALVHYIEELKDKLIPYKFWEINWLCELTSPLSPGQWLLELVDSPSQQLFAVGVFRHSGTMPPLPRCYMHHKAKEPSSSTPPSVTPSRNLRNVVHLAKQFVEHIPNPIKEEIFEAEVAAKETRPCITNEEILKDFEALMPESGVSLYLKILDLAWQHKFIMGKILVEKGEEYHSILLQLDDITRHLQQMANHLGLK